MCMFNSELLKKIVQNWSWHHFNFKCVHMLLSSSQFDYWAKTTWHLNALTCFLTKNNTRLPKDESTSTIYWFRCTTSGKRGTKTFCWTTKKESRNLPCNSRQFGLKFTLTTFESISMIELSNFQWSITSKLYIIVYDVTLKDIWIKLKVHLQEYNCHHNII